MEKYDTSSDLLTWMESNFRQYGDVFRASAYGTEIYVVSNPEYADHVLRENWQNYRKGQAIKRIGFLLGNGLMVSEGAFWKQQRQMVQTAFHNEAVTALCGMMVEVNTGLLKTWEQAARDARAVNVTSDVSRMVLNITLQSIFGEDYEQVAEHFAVLSGESARNLQFAQTFRPLGRLIAGIATQRRQHDRTGRDILGMLMDARVKQSGATMSDAQLTSEVLTLIVAGHETTASTLNWIWYLLSQHTEAEERLAEELGSTSGDACVDASDLQRFVYTRRVIEEALRLYPAGWLMTRKALKDDQLGEYFVPAGTEVYISPYLIQRNPAIWDNPDKFDPDRFDPARHKPASSHRHAIAMLPFSAGPRKCIGEFFARTEMQIHLMTIGRRVRLEWHSGKPEEIEYGVNLRSKQDFLMNPRIRQ